MFYKYLVLLFVSAILASCTASPTQPGSENQVASASPASPLLENTTQSGAAAQEDLSFSADTMESVLPDDIIQEVRFFGGMGGCGRYCACTEGSDTKPTLYVEDGPVEVFQDIGFQVCGIDPQEMVSVEVLLPDGTMQQFSGEAYYGIEYYSALHDPVGEYQLTFSGDGWSLKTTIEVVDADGPRLYLTEDRQLIFYKFMPGENVRLLAYQDGHLIGWRAYVMDGSGELSIDTDLDAGFVAVGERSGQAFAQEPGAWLGWETGLGFPIPNLYCHAQQIEGLKPDGYAVTLNESLPTYEYDSNLREWSQGPNLDLAAGSRMRVLSNPVCIDGAFVWLISCMDQQCQAWVPQSSAGHPNLQSVHTLPPSPTPDPSNIPACPGTKPTRLQVGMNAEVTTSGMAPQLSLRAEPGMGAGKVHVIAAGRDLVILRGPVCADESYWWYIRSEQGFEGWAREGDNEDYWIDPLP